MALSALRELSTSKKALVLLGAGGLIAGCAYVAGKSGLLSSFSVFSKGPVQELPEKRVLVLGLDGAGKSSLLQYLNTSEGTGNCEPTEGFNVMCVQVAGVSLNIWEVGGSEGVRSYWDNFLQGTEVLVYVVDAADDSRFEESKSVLQKLLLDPKLKKVPIVLVANKQDIPGAKNGIEVQEAVGLISPDQDREVYVVETQSVPGAISTDSIQQIKTYMRTLTNK